MLRSTKVSALPGGLSLLQNFKYLHICDIHSHRHMNNLRHLHTCDIHSQTHKYNKNKSLKNKKAGEMVKSLIALIDDPYSVFVTHMVAHNHPQLQL